jgi:CRP-like cAMP-binding protein
MSTAPDAAQLESHNRLLAALPAEAHARLVPHLERIALGLKTILYEPNEPMRHVYFPLNGVVSWVADMDDGLGVEVATIGNEGLLGLPVFLGAERMPGQAFSQVPGEALRLTAEVFLREATPEGPFRALLHRYTQALMVQVPQSGACNRRHTDEQRGARWLLMSHDRVGADQFPLTQEFLAQMLGVRRARVNAVAGALRKRGLITYQRGLITVLDRAGLEAAACLCYGIIKAEYDRLLRA